MINMFQSACCFCQDYESSAMWYVKNDDVPAEVHDIQSHVQPVVVKQEPDDVCCVIYAVFKQKISAGP